MIELSVITPVWNQADTTMAWLYNNWRLYASRPEVEFIIIDNGSTDKTPQLLAGWQARMGDRLKVITNKDNRGFGPANNQGAAIARADTLAFISNDVTPTGDYASRILQAIEPDVLAGAELLHHNTGWNTFNGQIIAYIAGWCVATSKRTFETLGGWDERYIPCDYEDLDLSLTAVRKGKTLLKIQLPLMHRFGQSAEHLPGGRRQITEKNRDLFIKKWGFNNGNAE